jgi:hypothetical protein
VIDFEILPRPQDERRSAARAGGRAEPHRFARRRAAVVAKRRHGRLAVAQLGLDGGRNARQVVEPAQVLAPEARLLELPLEERNGQRPDAIELAGQTLGLQHAHALQRHRLDLGIVVALLASRTPVAHALVLRSSIASA